MATREDARSRTAAVGDFGREHPLAPIALGVFLYSLGPVFVQASDVSGPVFSFWRLWFGVGVFAAATSLWTRRRGGWPPLAAWRWPAWAGVAFGVHQLMLFSAIKATSVVDVTLVNTTSPIVTAVMAVPFFRERPGAGFRLWSLLAMVGAGVVVLAGASGPGGDPVGMAVAVGNVVAFAAFFLLSKGSRDHLGTLPFLSGVMAVAAVVVSGYVALVGEPVASAGRTDLLYAVVVAAGPGFLGHFVMTWPLRWVPANVPPVMRLGVPVLAATWAWWFLGEGISALHVVGGAVTMAGVAGAVLSPAGRRFLAGEGVDPEPSSG